MENNKIVLADESRIKLRFIRQQLNLSAENVAVEIGKSKAWLGQIERGKLHSIKTNNLIELLNIYKNHTENAELLKIIDEFQRQKSLWKPAIFKVKSCDKCPFFMDEYPACNFTGKLIMKMGEEENGFPSECPLCNGMIYIEREGNANE